MKQRKIALFAVLLSMIVGCYFYYNRESPSAHFDQHIVDAIHTPDKDSYHIFLLNIINYLFGNFLDLTRTGESLVY